MKKIYLKKIPYNELKKLCLENRDFINYYGQIIYEDNMFIQERTGEAIFGDNRYEYIDIISNYNSFYLRLKDWRGFIENIDDNYLEEKELALYNYIINKKEILDNMYCHSERFNHLEYHLEQKCKELLNLCEKALHKFENYPSDDEVFNTLYENKWYSNENYYTDKERKKIYKDISYTKIYN